MKPIPDWLAPHKNEWLTQGGLQKIIAFEGASFMNFFIMTKDRLKSVSVECRTNKNGLSKKYLVKHFWAMALAHNLHPISPEVLARMEHDRIVEDQAKKIEYLERQLTQLKGQILGFKDEAGAISSEVVGFMCNLHEPTRSPGVYFLIDSDDKVVYVGQSKNVLARMSGHAAKEFVRVRMFDCHDDEHRLLQERKLIKMLKPKFNISCMPREAAEC